MLNFLVSFRFISQFTNNWSDFFCFHLKIFIVVVVVLNPRNEKMFDFNRLKGLVNENTNRFSGIPYTSLPMGSNAEATGTTSSTTTTTAGPTTGGNYFSQLFGQMRQGSTTSLDTEPTDGWFREADSDPFCPKLVSVRKNKEENLIVNYRFHFIIPSKKKSRTQRITGFMICLIMGAFLMLLASFYIPVIFFKSRKFVLLFSLGSIFFIAR